LNERHASDLEPVTGEFGMGYLRASVNRPSRMASFSV
jgi:hypothetical protein